MNKPPAAWVRPAGHQQHCIAGSRYKLPFGHAPVTLVGNAGQQISPTGAGFPAPSQIKWQAAGLQA